MPTMKYEFSSTVVEKGFNITVDVYNNPKGSLVTLIK